MMRHPIPWTNVFATTLAGVIAVFALTMFAIGYYALPGEGPHCGCAATSCSIPCSECCAPNTCSQTGPSVCCGSGGAK